METGPPSPDEFPGTELGGSGGGAAFKFGIFYRRDADTWIAGGLTPRGHEISVDEAVVIATRQRDQFIAGCELLHQLPEDADDAAYREFQRQLHEVAPDVADLAWGHKYFYLMFPDKLDDFHSPVWQRFYLLKSLQSPSVEEGQVGSTRVPRELDDVAAMDRVHARRNAPRPRIARPLARQAGLTPRPGAE